VREAARQRKAEKFLIAALRGAEEGDAPVVLFDAYADAAERYGLQEWRLREDRPTVRETTAETRARYERATEAITAYVLKGGRSRWGMFCDAVIAYAEAGIYGVLNARDALYDSAEDFSESTDPAFAGLLATSDSGVIPEHWPRRAPPPQAAGTWRRSSSCCSDCRSAWDGCWVPKNAYTERLYPLTAAVMRYSGTFEFGWPSHPGKTSASLSWSGTCVGG